MSLIDGAVGKLEVRLGKNFTAGVERVMVICHPHPLYQGTMNNKVITTIERAAANVGVATICFNFRGVGKSEGEYDQGNGEVDDLFAVLAWLQQQGVQSIDLAGFSFGSYIALQAQQRQAFRSLLMVAPPVGLYDFSAIDLNNAPEKWLTIVAGSDEVVSAPEIVDWYRKLSSQPDFIVRASASHFFHGQLVWLRQQVEWFLDEK